MDWRDDGRPSPFGWGGVSADERTSRRWRRPDWVLVLALMLFSALTSFTDLGNRTGPQTFWKPDASGEGFVADFGEVRAVDRVNLYEGPGATGKSKIESSVDGVVWEPYEDVEHKTNRVFTWISADKSVQARYMRFTAERTGFRLYEAGFFAKGDDKPIPVTEITPVGKPGAESEGGGGQVFDEQDVTPYRPDYRNSMYFDEIYHGRTAYEFIHQIEPYENTHPPLGKWLLTFGIRLFDMTPYGWRFMAAVCGTLMVPVFYAAAKGMFRRTRYAFIATLLLTLEGFHLVHSRMANVDIFGVTFTILMYYMMYLYGETAWRNGGFGRSFRYLALSGAFFGCAAAVKWNYLYGGAGLAILFLIALLRRKRESRLGGERGYAKKTAITLLSCLILFVAVPAGIYTASYIPYEKATKADDGLKDLIRYQENMYDYHKGVKEKHPYASKWYTWPEMLRPVWYYGGKDLAGGQAQSIAAIGNPLVWWGGLIALLVSWWLGARSRDRIVLTVAVMYLSFYVPWMVAPRSITFLYHYFPMVPLLIISIVWMLRWFEERSRYGKQLTALTLTAAAVLFVWFYPVLTGMTISREWMNLGIRWLPSWGF
ncbi:glycosyltransferase family 39 protein [Cohnella sp. REN36]|uniref:glycosyltransferase family 39 protein n=1 Tax=Cohnella sp. REN36 TaxID=2887347 RepID=UPI001D137761|nr:glycosyltransferase family 39 protein [Cohnella sp. REN36]MCC3375795.1 glycosyltransferase family 39 protein [Cohnella sp. REN36]